MSVASDGIWFPIADNQQSDHSDHQDHPTDDQPADNVQAIINPHETSSDELPVLVGAVDLPVYKRDRTSAPMVLCNGGLHVHALIMMPPISRLKESLADHFQKNRDLYAGSEKYVQRIHVRPVVEDHERVVDYILKTVLSGRLSYDEAVLVLPRSRGELESG